MFDEQGFEVVNQVLLQADCDVILSKLSCLESQSAGTRNILSEAWCRNLVQTLHAHHILQRLIPANFVAVQCTYFEKSVNKNWLVPIHQDLSIPVGMKVNSSTLTGWSLKEDVLFVQPPDSLLAELIAVRLHLDDCGSRDGPLKVIPGSHKVGRISPELALKIRTTNGELSCESKKGDALVMRPLLLHASSKSVGESRRRVLHFLFGPNKLPYGLCWEKMV